jgi:hypothetical protein
MEPDMQKRISIEVVLKPLDRKIKTKRQAITTKKLRFGLIFVLVVKKVDFISFYNVVLHCALSGFTIPLPLFYCTPDLEHSHVRKVPFPCFFNVTRKTSK